MSTFIYSVIFIKESFVEAIQFYYSRVDAIGGFKKVLKRSYPHLTDDQCFCYSKEGIYIDNLNRITVNLITTKIR